MKVKLRNPDRVVDVSGPKTVSALLGHLGIVPEAVLVIRDATLLTRDEAVSEHDEIEVRPVLSGGSREGGLGRRPEQNGGPALRHARGAATR
ncbi:MAG TPA: MoaD/ThiS family protein [Actinomycetota bacterium]|nr:MoaD/ThiS family protein [Actinomycetota bacterium]